MAEEKTNTQKIMEAVANIPELSKIWAEAIKDQNDTSVWGAWNATVKYFLPNHSSSKPFEILDLFDAENPPPEIKSASIQSLKCISEILNTLDETTSLGEEEHVLSYSGMCPEGALIQGEYHIYLTYTLDGFCYRMDEENAEKESWISSTLLSENELVDICWNADQEGIELYATWVLGFTIHEAGADNDFIYTIHVSDDDQYCYVEEPDKSRGDYYLTARDAFNGSSLKMDKNCIWKVTEGRWDKERILSELDWEDFNIEWQSEEEEQEEE